jgi:hypothetical protein
MTFTQGFIAVMVSITIIVDVALAIFFGSKNTISRTLYVLSSKYPIIPFGLGVVAGHILWPNS